MNYSKEVFELNKEVLAELGEPERPAKYHNVKTDSFGLRFDSGHEAVEIGNLLLAEKHKTGVFGLRLQVRFPLPGKSDYVADATYLQAVDGFLIPVVVDAKGVRTPLYKLKKKLFKQTYGVEITEL